MAKGTEAEGFDLGHTGRALFKKSFFEGQKCSLWWGISYYSASLTPRRLTDQMNRAMIPIPVYHYARV